MAAVRILEGGPYPLPCFSVGLVLVMDCKPGWWARDFDGSGEPLDAPELMPMGGVGFNSWVNEAGEHWGFQVQSVMRGHGA